MSSVDVIVPCYNYGRYLRQCVESVLAQQGVAVRVLIIDDASSDNTPEVARALAAADSRVTFLQHASNKGHIATYNEGIDWISADYYLLLSADDYLIAGAFARAAAILEANQDVGLVFGKSFELRGDSPEPNLQTRLDACYWSMSGARFIEISGPYNLVPTATAVVRTSLQKTVGGYDPRLPHAGDMEMWLRLAAHASVAYVGEWQAVARMHGSNMQGQYFGEDGGLPDLKQRKLAIDSFLAKCGSVQPRVEVSASHANRELARLAVSAASACFNAGNLTAMESALTFAREIDSEVFESSEWIKLKYKLRMGLLLWKLVSPALTSMRTRESAKADMGFKVDKNAARRIEVSHE